MLVLSPAAVSKPPALRKTYVPLEQSALTSSIYLRGEDRNMKRALFCSTRVGASIHRPNPSLRSLLHLESTCPSVLFEPYNSPPTLSVCFMLSCLCLSCSFSLGDPFPLYHPDKHPPISHDTFLVEA